jgi:hypothetical protein
VYIFLRHQAKRCDSGLFSRDLAQGISRGII